MASGRCLVLSLLVGSAACAHPPLPDADVLEQRVEREPADRHARLLLAARLIGDGRADEADRLLAAAPGSDRSDPDLVLMRAVAADAAGQVLVAVDRYEEALARDSDLRNAEAVAGRLTTLAPALVRARLLAGGEDEGRTPPVVQGRIVVLPFRVDSVGLEPVAEAVRALLTADLSTAGSLSAVARERVDAAVVAASVGGAPSDLAEAVGSLLGAEWAVAAVLSPEGTGRLRILARVHPVSAVGGQVVRTVDVVENLDGIYDAGKRLAEAVYREAGHPLAGDDRLDLGLGQSRDTDALMSFGRGLRAMDEGRFDDARRAFSLATAGSPGFRLAAFADQRAALAASAPTPGVLAATVARASVQRARVEALVGASLTGALPERASLAELLGLAGIDGTFLDLVVTVDRGGR